MCPLYVCLVTRYSQVQQSRCLAAACSFLACYRRIYIKCTVLTLLPLLQLQERTVSGAIHAKWRRTGYPKSPPSGQGEKSRPRGELQLRLRSREHSKLPCRQAPLFPRLRRPTDADPASDPGIDETVTSRPVDLYHARPRSLDGSDARPDKAGASGVLTCSHSPSLIFTPPRVDPGAHSHYPCAPYKWDGHKWTVPPQSRCVF